jgi:hypothetical protein
MQDDERGLAFMGDTIGGGIATSLVSLSSHPPNPPRSLVVSIAQSPNPIEEEKLALKEGEVVGKSRGCIVTLERALPVALQRDLSAGDELEGVVLRRELGA